MPARETNNGLLQNICRSFRPFVQELYKDLNFGFCRSKIEIERLFNSSNDKNSFADQFTLVLPYAGHRLKWEIIFDSARPWFAPDFRFDDETFLSDVDPDFIEEHVPSLAQWNDRDPKSLSRVITELMNLYREHQKELLSTDKSSRAYFEYTTLIGSSEMLGNDVEILVGKGSAVSFMIKLNIDDSKLPALFGESDEENPGGECAILLVKYPNPAKVELIMSPLVSRAVSNVSLPPVQETALLMDYVPEVTELINQKIERVLANEKLKQELLTRLIAKYESSLLQHGSDTATFLFDVDGFHCIVRMDTENNYPEHPPQFTLQSVYHFHKGKPAVKMLIDCPYNDIEVYIKQEILNFKAKCEEIPT